MPEARVLGTTQGYKGNLNVTNSKSGLYKPREYKPSQSYDPFKSKAYTTKPYNFNTDSKTYETKVQDPFKQKIHTYDKVQTYDHYYTYGLPGPRKDRPRPAPKRTKPKEEEYELSLFPKGVKMSTVGTIKRTLRLSRDNKVNPNFTPLPGW